MPPISLTINYVTVAPNQDTIRGSHECERCRANYNFSFRPESPFPPRQYQYGTGSASNPLREVNNC